MAASAVHGRKSARGVRTNLGLGHYTRGVRLGVVAMTSKAVSRAIHRPLGRTPTGYGERLTTSWDGVGLLAHRARPNHPYGRAGSGPAADEERSPTWDHRSNMDRAWEHLTMIAGLRPRRRPGASAASARQPSRRFASPTLPTRRLFELARTSRWNRLLKTVIRSTSAVRLDAASSIAYSRDQSSSRSTVCEVDGVRGRR